MKKAFIFLSFIIICCILHSCQKSNTDVDKAKIPVASVKDQVLYEADLKNALPFGLTGEDSINAAKAYIDGWIKDKLIYDKAIQNIANQTEIEQLVEDYRKSLVTNIYQERLLKEYFSNIITDKELRDYYDKNKEKLILEENIIRGLYLKIPVNSPQLANFQKWYKQGTDAALENIESNTLQNAMGYDYFYDRWVGFNDIMTNVPIIINDEQQLLKANKNIEVSDSSFVYLINIKEYRLSGTEAPYEYIKSSLQEVFLEQRKADYIKQVRTDLYDKALSSDEIKFYE